MPLQANGAFVATVLIALLLIVGALPPPLLAAGARSRAHIKTDYSQLQRTLTQGRDGKSWRREDPTLRELLDKAWPLMGEWAVAYLQREPHATAENLVAAMDELNPERPPASSGGGVGEPRVPDDVARRGGWIFGLFTESNTMDAFFQELESYRVTANAITLEAGGAPAYAIAISYGYEGRLLVVSERGTHASAEIHRGGALFPLPRTPTGHDRFYVDANPNDWPTSSCGGGQLSVWEWDGDRAAQLVMRDYGYPRFDDRHVWGVHRRGRWIKVYTRNELEMIHECCACRALKALRKIRIGPERVVEFGIGYVVPEFALVDDLLNRAMRGLDSSDIAAPEVASNLGEVFQALSATPLDPWMGLLESGRAVPDTRGTVFTVSTDDIEFVFRITRPGGRLFVAEMLKPQPRAAAFLGAVRARLKEMGRDPLDVDNLLFVAQQVVLERPDLLPDEDDFERISYCGALWPCGLLPAGSLAFGPAAFRR